ncbi:MAG TPA: TetR/AcrR family transcriptional regulator [Acidimicrobiales bacterium]
MQRAETMSDGLFPGLDEAPSKILRAAIGCMRQFGSSKTSMADVAKASGYSRATVYKYFTNRQELVDAVFDQGRMAFFNDLEAAARTRDRFGDQMAATARVLMKYLYDEANSPWAGLLDPLDEALITRQHAEELISELAQFATAFAREAAERNEIRDGLDAGQIGEWLGRLLFAAHFTEPTEMAIRSMERSIRALCELIGD